MERLVTCGFGVFAVISLPESFLLEILISLVEIFEAKLMVD